MTASTETEELQISKYVVDDLFKGKFVTVPVGLFVRVPDVLGNFFRVPVEFKKPSWHEWNGHPNSRGVDDEVCRSLKIVMDGLSISTRVDQVVCRSSKREVVSMPNSTGVDEVFCRSSKREVVSMPNSTGVDEVVCRSFDRVLDAVPEDVE